MGTKFSLSQNFPLNCGAQVSVNFTSYLLAVLSTASRSACLTFNDIADGVPPSINFHSIHNQLIAFPLIASRPSLAYAAPLTPNFLH
jgi:hypothetical protein